MSLVLYILLHEAALSWPPFWSSFSVLDSPSKIQSHLFYEDLLDDVIPTSYLKTILISSNFTLALRRLICNETYIY